MHWVLYWVLHSVLHRVLHGLFGGVLHRVFNGVLYCLGLVEVCIYGSFRVFEHRVEVSHKLHSSMGLLHTRTLSGASSTAVERLSVWHPDALR